jgi:pyridoxamine 5'-phosphate oxidase
MYRAIRFRGMARQLGRQEVERYFGERPWGSRIGAWASQQPQVIEGRSGLEEAYQRYAAQWPDRGGPTDVPVPDFWGGFRIICDEVEFWARRPSPGSCSADQDRRDVAWIRALDSP